MMRISLYTMALAGTLALTLLIGTVRTSHAACQWRWDCTRSPCRQVPLCDSTLDLPPIKPLEVPPLPPLAPLKPLPPLEVPPLGTSTCAQRYLCQGGACGWQTVCR